MAGVPGTSGTFAASGSDESSRSGSSSAYDGKSRYGTTSESDESRKVHKAKVRKPLSAAVARLGSGVLLHCAFIQDDITYTYVMWRLGLHLIERSSSNFRVFRKGGDTLLYIRELEADMAGVVTCQLRQAVLSQVHGTSELLATTSCTLSIAPTYLYGIEKPAEPLLKPKRIFQARSGLDTNIPSTEQAPHPTEAHDTEQAPHSRETHDTVQAPHPTETRDTEQAPHPTEAHDPEQAPHPTETHDTVQAPQSTETHDTEQAPHPTETHDPEQVLDPTEIHDTVQAPHPTETHATEQAPHPTEIHDPEQMPNVDQANSDISLLFCKITRESLYYLYASISDVEVNSTLQIEEGDPNKIRIDVDPSNLSPNYYYAVDVTQSNDRYMEVGVSSQPSVEIKEFSNTYVIKMRMRPILPSSINRTVNSLVMIEKAPYEEQPVQLKSTELRHNDIYRRNYTFVKLLSESTYGQVVLSKDDHDKYFIAKELVTNSKHTFEKACQEYTIMKKLNHEKIVHLIEAYKGPHSYVLVMEYLWGGQLFDRMVSDEHLQEEDVVSYVRQLCEGLAYIHRNGIIHLDIKPENIVCRNPNTSEIKIIDFGISQEVSPDLLLDYRTGTRDFISPEIVKSRPVTTATDMWSLGVVTYILLSGTSPFREDTRQLQNFRIMKAEYDYDGDDFKHVSALSKQFVDSLLLLNPPARLTAEQALQHPWLKNGPPKVSKTCMKRIRERLKVYLTAYRSKRKRAGNDDDPAQSGLESYSSS